MDNCKNLSIILKKSKKYDRKNGLKTYICLFQKMIIFGKM